MYFLKRLTYMIPLLLVISAVSFWLVHLAPGGPFDKERAPASPQIKHNLEAKYHLDEPVWKQYLRYVGGLAHGDFGPSLKYRDHSVTDIVLQGLPVSMLLGWLAFGFAMGVGLPAGFITAVQRGRWQDHVGSFLALLAVCIPGFVIAPILVLVFTIKWHLLPVALWESPAHAVLPTIALGLYFAGKIARLFREGMLNTMQMEFVTAARAKGLGENTLLMRHAVRLAVLPVVSYAGPMLADLFTGSFVIENIFQIPGLGVFFINSSLNSDYTMTVGLALLYAVLLIVLNLVVDFAYMLLDPRVKYE
ncbi:MAG TPA: ABC transporter permease [Verrucomicrobiae bacterium]|jgi:oligopeptide transport system permease protein|nr:ABC transporter permease [Verrucomicrobiae bacterium]